MLYFLQRRITVLFIGVSLISNFLISCGQKYSQPVARVGGRIITVQQFKDEFSRGKSQVVLVKTTLQDKLDYLNRMIDKELQIVAAYRKKLDKDEDIIKKVEKRGETTILRRLVDKEVIDPNIPDSEIKKFYNMSKKQMKILEIVLKMNPNATEQERKIVEDKLNAINLEIQNGTDFATLIEKYSQDQASKSSLQQGEKGILKWTPFTADDPVYQKAFSMKVGEISEPIKTKNGYSIIKVVEKIKPAIKPFSIEKRRIRQELIRLHNSDLEKKYFEFLENLKKKFEAKFMDDNIQKFVQIINTASTDTMKRDRPPFSMDTKDISQKFSYDEKKLPLVTYRGGEITIQDFIDELNKYPMTRRPNISNKEEMYSLIDRRVLSYILMKKEANGQNIKEDKEVEDQFKAFTESYMMAKIKEMEVKKKVTVTEEDLKKYFDEHREELKNPEQREVQEIFVKDEKLANEIAKRAKAGESFTKLVRKYNEKASTKKNNGNLGFIQKSRPYIGQPAFETNVGGVAGPIKIGKNYSIIKVLRIQEPTYKTFDEAKSYLRPKLERDFTTNREKEWMEELRKEIEVTIYEKRLEKAFSNLNSEKK